MCYEKVLSDQTTVKRTAWVDLQQNQLYLADYEIHCRCNNPNINLLFKQKAVANCVWMLVVKIEGNERIY